MYIFTDFDLVKFHLFLSAPSEMEIFGLVEMSQFFGNKIILPLKFQKTKNMRVFSFSSSKLI